MRIGTFIKTPAPHIVEILGLTGLDFGVIDAEHGPFDRTSADLLMMAGRASGLPLLVRVPNADASTFLWALDIGAATDLPVSADLEDGYGAEPERCAETVRLAAEAGLCGCTIEDTTADPAAPIHGFDLAVARVRAAALAARAAPHPFVLTARAENFLHGRPDLNDTVRRLVAFAEAGADCLYAPGLPTLAAIRAVVAAVSPKPVNVLSGPGDGLVPHAVLEAAGVRRISVGGVLARAAYGQVLAAGRSLLDGDLLGALRGVPSHADIQAVMRPAS